MVRCSPSLHLSLDILDLDLNDISAPVSEITALQRVVCESF